MPCSPGAIQVIQRAAALLRALEHATAGLSLAQLACATRLPRSTVQRIVGSLVAEQLLLSAADGLVLLGPALTRLGVAAESSMVARFKPQLQKIADETGETVDLSVLSAGKAVVVYQIQGNSRLRTASSVGMQVPLHAGANGKSLLAWLAPESVGEHTGGVLEACTPHTTVDMAHLLSELEEVRRTGISWDFEEHVLGVCAAGMGIPDSGGRAVAISIPVPAIRFYGRESIFEQALRKAHGEILVMP